MLTIERLRETLTELTAATEQQKTAISGLEKDQYAAKCRHAAEVQRLTRALQATERCNARESGRVTIFDTQVKALNAKIAKYLGVVDATSANNAVYLGSDNVKMSRLEENVARLLRRLEALQSLTDSTRERANDERLDLLDVMQLPHSTGNIRLACCRIMSKIYVVIQSLQKDVDQLTTELGLESTMSAHLSTVTCDKKAERIHVAIVAIKADVARIHRRISEGGIPKATLNRKHKISVATSGTGYKTSPLSPKTPVPTPSPRWPLQHAKAGQLPSVLDQKDTEKRRFFGDDWNRTLPPVAMTRDVGRQAGSQRRQGTFLAS